MGRTILSSKVELHQSTMFTQASILATLVLSASSLSLENLKAASSVINCGCQCSSITFLDSAGVEQGNCKTVDGTGAQWCYVDHLPSTCQDMVPSQRFPHNPWSYEACATPAIGTYLCPAYNTVVEVADHVHVPVVVPADNHVHVPLVVPADNHVHVSAPTHVHDYVGQHNTEIPQGFNAPIPKTTGLKAPEK